MSNDEDRTAGERLENALRETTALNRRLKEREDALATVGRALARLETQQVEDREWELEQRRMRRTEYKEQRELQEEEKLRSITRLQLYEREVVAREHMLLAILKED